MKNHPTLGFTGSRNTVVEEKTYVRKNARVSTPLSGHSRSIRAGGCFAIAELDRESNSARIRSRGFVLRLFFYLYYGELEEDGIFNT
jgi:hypothetical protein